MLKAKFRNYYRSAKGNLVFVYTVTGNEAELEAYEAAQGSFFRKDNETGDVLFFSPRILSDNKNASVNLLITSNNRVVADDADMMFAEEVALRKEVAKQKAKIMARQALLGGMVRSQSSVTPQAIPVPDAIGAAVENATMEDTAVASDAITVEEPAGGSDIPS